MKIILRDNKIITRRELFRKKEEFHKEQAKLSFVEKIKILINLQKIANSIRKPQGIKQKIWRISF